MTRARVAATALLAASSAISQPAQPPLIESFRLDLEPAAVRDGQARHARALATEAYLVRLPSHLHLRQLADYLQGRAYLAPGEPALGGWFLLRELATPQTPNTLPNVDTLYGAAFVWLDRQGPVVLSLPPIDAGRYHSVALGDTSFNNFAILGSRDGADAAGHYLIVPPGWKGEAPAGIRRVVHAPTSMIHLYQRIYLKQADDIAAVRRLQDQITLTPLERWQRGERGFAALDDRAFRVGALAQLRDPLRLFELSNAYAALTRPGVLNAPNTPLDAALAGIGITPGAQLPQEPHLREAIAAGAADAQAAIDASLAHGPFRNGWRVPHPDSGKAGGAALTRAVFQITQIGSLPNDEAMYFFGFRDGRGRPLDGRKAARLTFGAGQLPPVNAPGFWSLTMYDEGSHLVDNPQRRYIIRPDTPGLAFGADGSLSIALQADPPGDPAPANWLPAPRGNYVLALRAYLPQPPMLDGRWFPPPVVMGE